MEPVEALRFVPQADIGGRFSPRGGMTDHAMPDGATNAADLFEIIRTTRSKRQLKPDRCRTN
jgi:hypothetical protein